MIRNGLYSVISKVLDGIEGNSVGVSVVQDGTMRGGALSIITSEATPALTASGRAN